MPEFELKALDGSNLLAFLAALGTLRVLTLADPGAEVKMRWRDKGWWTPVLHHSRICSEDELIEALAQCVCDPTKAPRFSQCDLDVDRSEYRQVLLDSLDRKDDLDQFACLGSEFYAAKDNKPTTGQLNAVGPSKKGKPVTGFLGYIRKICAETSPNQLREALLDRWTYSDPSPMMRWDPNELRSHALRAKDPAPDQSHFNVRGANRLAIEALPLFVLVPTEWGPRTVGFSRDRSSLRWPVWTEPVGLSTATSLLSLQDLFQNIQSLPAWGIAQVFESQRLRESDYYLNFTPARALL